MMSMSELKEKLRPWMKVSTWHTNHPLDEKRFHKALQSVFSTLGVAIDGGSFEEAMNELVEEYHPDLEQSYKDLKIQGFALQAEHIASYLQDT